MTLVIFFYQHVDASYASLGRRMVQRDDWMGKWESIDGNTFL